MRIFTTVVCLFLTHHALAIDYCSKNHFHIGVNAFYRNYSEDLIRPKKSEEYGMLFGIILDYEHKAPESIMFDLSYNLAKGKTRYDGSMQSSSYDTLGNYLGPVKDTTDNTFINLDTEIGYTFLIRSWYLLTPFIGLGINAWDRELSDGVDEVYFWGYASAGLQYDYDVNSYWQYGLHLKVMQMLHGKMDLPDNSSDSMTLGDKTHFEISAPIIYKPDPQSDHYWRFTPYYQYQSFGESDIIYLHINNSSGNFYAPVYEPASRTHIIGAEVEFGF